MRTVDADEASRDFSRLLDAVGQGEEVLVTRKGQPVAVLRPYPAVTAARQESVAHAQAVMERAPASGRASLHARRDARAVTAIRATTTLGLTMG